MNEDRARATASSTVVVLDLDDTLYPEADYARSGRDAVESRLKTLFPVASETIGAAFAALPPDAHRFDIASLLARAGLPASLEEELVWVYRLHRPKLAPRPGTMEWIERARERYAALVVLTDGRGLAQRQKLAALGLSDLDVLVSVEHDGPKPAPARFALVETRYGGARHVYIGDNPAKDFVAPRRRGWLAVGLRDTTGRNVHTRPLADCSEEQLPHHWIDGLDELDELLARRS